MPGTLPHHAWTYCLFALTLPLTLHNNTLLYGGQRSYRLKTTTTGTSTRIEVKRHSNCPDPVLYSKVIFRSYGGPEVHFRKRLYDGRERQLQFTNCYSPTAIRQLHFTNCTDCSSPTAIRQLRFGNCDSPIAIRQLRIANCDSPTVVTIKSTGLHCTHLLPQKWIVPRQLLVQVCEIVKCQVVLVTSEMPNQH